MPQQPQQQQMTYAAQKEIVRKAEEEKGTGAPFENSLATGAGKIYDLVCCVCTAAGLAGNLATVTQGEMGVVTTFGRYDRLMEPGRHRFNICTEKVQNMSIMETVLDVARQRIMSIDNLLVMIDAVAYVRVVDPMLAAFYVEDYRFCLDNLVQVTLRTVVGQHTLAEVLAERQKIGARIRELLAFHTAAWGIDVRAVEMKQIDMDPVMQRALAAKSEATQQADAKKIQAEAQRDAAEILAQAGKAMAAEPGALQLQWYETMRVIATTGRNTTLVVPDVAAATKR